jgi:hypothetical protein
MATPASRAQDRLQSRGFLHVVRWAIVMALWTLLISMASGRFGIANFMQLKDAAETLGESNMRLAVENQMLEARIAKLQSSASARRLFVMEDSGRLFDARDHVVHLAPIPTHPLKPQESKDKDARQERLAQRTESPGERVEGSNRF